MATEDRRTEYIGEERAQATLQVPPEHFERFVREVMS